MSKFSAEKLKQIAESKNLTYKKISEGLDRSMSTVTKVFGGFRTNMQLDFLLKLADYLECTIDDFVEYDNDNISFFTERKELGIATTIYNNKKLLNLFSACEKLSDDEIDILNRMVRTFKQ